MRWILKNFDKNLQNLAKKDINIFSPVNAKILPIVYVIRLIL
jgi:hypothetical protein